MPTTIFTDGASKGNPGPGGWAAVLVIDNDQKKDGAASGSALKSGLEIIELGGCEDMTTNNKMELRAAVEGVSHTAEDSDILVYTDSSYLINGITKWVAGWKRNGWMTKAKESVLNRDLWEKLDSLAQTRSIKWKYVGGHVGIVGNERCDHIATDLAAGMDIKLYKGPLANYDLQNVLDVSQDFGSLKKKTADRSRSKAQAYSYVSVIGGVIEVHHTWADCEKRVKGAKGARYKKSLNAVDEKNLIEEFGEI